MRLRTVLAGALGAGALVKLSSVLRQNHDVPGRSKSPGKTVLELGAGILQRKSPLRDFNVYVTGFHPMKDAPGEQMTAHHYCRVVNEDFMQCILFDGNGRDARLTGVEYIISEALFESLPDQERQLWHPHNYEILSGTLVAPGLPERAERELMRRMMNSYGKTWHFWMTGGQHAAELPIGHPCLAWSFNHDGEANEAMIARRDESLGISSEHRRRLRAELTSAAHPQEGVDAISDRFGGSHTAPPGVANKSRSAQGRS